MQSIVATLLIAGCAYSISASAGNVQIQVLGRDGKPVPEAVVVLYPSAATAATAPSLLQASPTIEQERMRFVPALTVVAPGTTLRFTNQDRWDHHVRGTPVGPAATAGAGGNEGFEMRLAGKQDGQAAQAAEDLKTKALLPAHVGRFSIAAHDWDEPFKQIDQASQGRSYRLLTPKPGALVALDQEAQRFPRWWKGEM